MKKDEKRISISVLLLLLALAAGCAARLILLGRIPFGLNQDEASIGYDAFTLLHYGIDRNGYPWPVYPITWGSGGGSPMMVYLVLFATKLFGRSILSLRLMPAFFGCLTIALFAVFARAAHLPDREIFAPVAVFLIAVNPWHLIMSRWALDANVLPFFLTAAVLTYAWGAESPEKKRLPKYLLSAALFALCPYAYGSATVVVPITLVILGILTIRWGRMRISELLLSALVFLIVFAPLGLFFAVNVLDLPPVVTPFFSLPRFTASRQVFYTDPAAFLQHIKDNIRYLIIFFTIGSEDGEIICNYVPGYAQMYRFTFPLTWIGMVCAAKRLREKSTADAAFLLITVITVIFTLFVEPDINRMTMLLVPFLYFQALALTAVIKRFRRAGMLVTALLVCVFVIFCRDYFGAGYAEQSKQSFMPGYVEAVEAAADIAGEDKEVISTYAHLQAPFMLALYAAETPPQVFLDSVEWVNPLGEFRITRHFKGYTFGLPEDLSTIDFSNEVLILHVDEVNEFPGRDDCRIQIFGDYAVLCK